MLPNQLKLSLLALSFGLAACTTAGTQLESSPPEELLFQTEEPDPTEQPVTEPDEAVEPTPSSIAFDPDIAGPAFEIADDGPTLAVTGQDGVWWFDANGKAHLVVEPAVAADYDGDGGLVFQRSASSPIVLRTAEAEETDIVAPGDGETIVLVGVATVGTANEVIYLRKSEGSALLERATLDDSITSSIVDMTRDGIAPTRLTISGGYVSGVYLEGAGAGWVTVSTASGSKLFGTAKSQLGACDVRDSGCAEVVTVSPDSSTVYQVMVSEDIGEWDLVLNNAADFSEIVRVNLQRPEGGWHATGIEAIDGLVIISRSANIDGTGDLPALAINTATSEITQLDRTGQAIAISG